jgi:3-phenylpropionate/trans-cinnamate dioxygenase ferredoxin component
MGNERIMSIPEIIGVMPAGAVPAGQKRAVSVLGMSLLVCNVDGEMFVLENRCSHAGATLDGGRLRGHELTCPMHGGRFDVRTGRCVKGPGTEPIRTFEVIADEERISILTG